MHSHDPQGRLDAGAVIVCGPGGDLRQAPDHAVPRGQVRGAQAQIREIEGCNALRSRERTGARY